MSNHVASLVRRHSVGLGFTAKAVLLLMADFASDDGSGVWASKARMARELETTERTIQRTIKTLIEAGILRQIGKRKVKNVETFEYHILCHVVERMPLSNPKGATEGRGYTQDVEDIPSTYSPDTVSPPTVCHPTPDSVSGLPPTVCHPNPSRTQVEPGGAGDALPDDCSQDQLLDAVMAAVGVRGPSIPTHWMPPAATLHVAKWRTELKLSPQRIVDAAKASRAHHPEPPNGPKALDGVMRRLAATISSPPMAPAANAPLGSSASTTALATYRSRTDD